MKHFVHSCMTISMIKQIYNKRSKTATNGLPSLVKPGQN